MQDLLLKIVNYYNSKLNNFQEAQDYLFSRGIIDFDKYQLGYADGFLGQFLIENGYSFDKLVELGLIFKNGNDRFINGIIFPYIFSNEVKTIRFRSLSDKKYMSLPKESLCYDLLFYQQDNLIKAKSSILLICEGEIDTITACQAGYHAIGIPGASVIPQCSDEDLSKVNNVYIVTDGDMAGDKAARMIVDRLGRISRRVKFPVSYDINQYVLEFGYDNFKQLLLQSELIEPEKYTYLFEGMDITPSAYECEATVVSACINYPEIITRVIEILGITQENDVRHFYGKTTQNLFKTILKLYFSLTPISFDIIREYSTLPKDRILEFVNKKVDINNIDINCKLLIKAFSARFSVEKAKDILNYAVTKKVTNEGIVTRLKEWTNDLIITENSFNSGITKNSLILARLKEIKRKQTEAKIYTGFIELDRMLTAGFVVRGQISTIGGRPREGKSAFKANLIRNLCEQGCCVVNVSPEQGLYSEHNRLDSIISGKNLKDFFDVTSSDFNKNMLPIINSNLDYISKNWNYFLMPSRDISFIKLISFLERLKDKQEVDVVFIDLFDKLFEITNAGNNIRYEIDKLINDCNVYAEKLNTHFCLLHQIRRLTGINRRDGGRPTLDDLKESGRFEQDSYLVYLIYRRGLHFKDEPDNLMEVILSKQKDGICGDNISVKLDFNKYSLILSNYEETSI